MKTNFLSQQEILKIQQSINNPDGVIAFPTDTVWGVGCKIDNPLAVNKIYSTKGRSKDKPLILLGKDLDSLRPYIKTMPELATNLAKKYFPGALTIILEKSDKTPDYITSGFNTVGIRVPNHPVFLEVLDKCTDNGVLATTSANLSGESAGINFNSVSSSIGSEVDIIIKDYGYSSTAQESTIIKIEENKINILRQGSIKL